MIEALGFFLLGIIFLALGGDSIIKAASGLAQRFGLSAFATGLVMVTIATSLPELAVNSQALFTGDHQLALGNAVGSNIVNIGLTLGLAAFVAPVMIRWRALSPLLLALIVATLALMVFGLNGLLVRWEGALLVAGFFAALGLSFKKRIAEQPEVVNELEGFVRTSTLLPQNMIRVVLALVFLYFGARWVVAYAPIIGVSVGMTPLITGMIIVAITTALPEIAGAILAAKRGQGDIVAGHVIGSSVFNLLFVIGGMAVVKDIAISASFVQFELPAALVFALMLLPILWRDAYVSRKEGALLVLAFFAWLAVELFLVWS